MSRILIIFLYLISSLTAFAHKERWDENKQDWSALMLDIYDGHTEKFIKLIAEGADVNFITPCLHSNWELSALEVAIRKENEVAVNALLQTNRILKPGSYLMIACAQNNAANVNQLIKYGANPNDTLENGYSVLMMAASFGSYEVLECLIKYGANVKQTRKIDGMTPLMFAAFNGEPKKVKLLLDHGAEKYARDSKGDAALNYVDQIYEYLKVSKGTKAEIRTLLK